MKSTRRRALYVFAALLGALFILACLAGFAACGGGSNESDGDTATVSSVSVTPTTLSLGLGEEDSKTGSVTATVTMSDGSDYDGDYTWSSSATSYATVSGSGKTATVTAVDDGTSNITVTAGGVTSNACVVTVKTTEPGGDGGDENPSGGDDEPELELTEVSTADELAAAVALGGEIDLTADIEITSALEVEADTTLDLAGKTLSTGSSWTLPEDDQSGFRNDALITVSDGATLTVTDSGTGTTSGSISYAVTGSTIAKPSGQSGTYDWNSSVNNGAAVVVDGGKLVVESGTIESSSIGIRAYDGDVTIEGGEVTSTGYYVLWEGGKENGNVSVTINDGVVAGATAGILVDGDSNFGRSGYAFGSTTNLTVNGGIVYSGGEKNAAIRTESMTSRESATIKITGGEVICGGGLTVDGEEIFKATDVNTKTSTMAAVFLANGTLEISGGTITGNGPTALEIQAGKATISGGTFVSSGTDSANTSSSSSDPFSYGYALAIYPRGDIARSSDADSITAGFTMAVDVTVNGGTFSGDVLVSDTIYKSSSSGEWGLNVTGSNYNVSISGVTVVVSAEEQLRWAVTIPGVTVCMNADITLTSSELTISVENVTLDLNGHALKDTDSNSNTQVIAVRGTVESPASLTIKDSSGGTGSIVGVQYGIFVVGEVETGVENTTAGGGTATATLTVEGGKIQGTAGAAISTNGQNKNNGHTNTYNRGGEVINIRDGEIVSTQSVGIYLPNGALNVSGGAISGTTGIEVRAGKVDITGGAVSTTVSGGSPSIGTGTNGPISNGYAIAVIDSTSSYNAIVSVTIGANVTLNGDIYSDVITDSEGNEVVTVSEELGLTKVAYDANNQVIEEANLESATVDHYVYTAADAGEET